MPSFVAGTPRNIHTKFCINPTIFQRLVPFFVRRQGLQKIVKNEIMHGFMGLIRAIFCENFQNFGNQLKLPKYTSTSKFEWLRHIWPKICKFSPFWGSIPPLLIYNGMCRPAVIPCLVLLAITFEPLSDLKNLGHFENPLGKGYMMLSTRKKSKKKYDLPLKKKTHLFDHVIHFKIFITWIISAKMLYLIEVR